MNEEAEKFPPDYHEGADDAAQFHHDHGSGGLRRGGAGHRAWPSVELPQRGAFTLQAAADDVILLAADFFLPMRTLGSFFHIAMNGMAASDKIFTSARTAGGDPSGERSVGADAGSNRLCERVVFLRRESATVRLGISICTCRRAALPPSSGASGCGKSTVALLC